MLEQTALYSRSTRTTSHPPLHGSRDDTGRTTTADPEASGPSLFGNLVDSFNPLHHIPVFSSLYRYATGREIGIIPRIASGALLGGPIGAGIAVIGSLIENALKEGTDAHHSDQPQAIQMAAATQQETPWYLSGSVAALNKRAATQNIAPENQDIPKSMVADGPLKKIPFDRTNSSDERPLAHFHQRLDPETLSTIQTIVQAHPHPSATANTVKYDNTA